jgi:hypothetical protein
VSKICQNRKANLRLYRNTEGPVCVPFACRDDETAQTTQTLAFEKSGVPAGLDADRSGHSHRDD